VRVLCSTEVQKLSNFRQKKSHVMEIQVNGGSIADKVQWGHSHLEQEFKVGDVFENNEIIDTVGITRGKGTVGPIKRFGCSRLNRKTHRGLRKVACIGAWHPSAVKWTVARRGQQGYHSRTEIHKKIYRVGVGQNRGVSNNAMCDADAIEKNITPMGGFPHYGEVRDDFLLIKGGVMGSRKRPIVIRKTLFPATRSWMTEQVDVKFIDTASKHGHGRYQTDAEKDKFLGKLASKMKIADRAAEKARN